MVTTQSNQKNLKILIFSVGKLTVALPVDSVRKVIGLPEVYSSGLNHFGIAHVEEREVTVVDLHKRLFKVSQVDDPSGKKYLVLIKNTVGEQFGIVSGETPVLVDVPLEQFRQLPPSYRQADTLEIASHVTVLKRETGDLTVFLLDISRILPTN